MANEREIAERRAARNKVRALAKEHGLTVMTNAAGPFEVMVECKPGHHFGGDVHELVTSAWDDETETDVWRQALERVTEELPHVEPCGPACEWWGE